MPPFRSKRVFVHDCSLLRLVLRERCVKRREVENLLGYDSDNRIVRFRRYQQFSWFRFFEVRVFLEPLVCFLFRGEHLDVPPRAYFRYRFCESYRVYRSFFVFPDNEARELRNSRSDFGNEPGIRYEIVDTIRKSRFVPISELGIEILRRIVSSVLGSSIWKFFRSRYAFRPVRSVHALFHSE